MNKRKHKTKVLIRTEASPTIGMGHLMRCLSLAAMLRSDFEISFLLNTFNAQVNEVIKRSGFTCNYLENKTEAEEDLFYNQSDIVVLDGYQFKPEHQQQIKQKGKALVFIDDLHNQHFYADVIFNVSDSVTKNDYSTEPYSRIFLGSQYALLREAFLEESKKTARCFNQIDSVFISMGAADSGNVTLKTLKAIKDIPSIKTVHAVIGAVNKHEEELMAQIKNNLPHKQTILHKNINAETMVSILNKCQLAICSASGVCVEASAVGIGLISGYTAENQLAILSGLIQKKCVISIGNFNNVSSDTIIKAITDCQENIEFVNEMIKNQKKLMDGYASQRINQIFSSLINENGV